MNSMVYDVAITGGGIAGLALSVDLAMRGYSCIVIEKGNYPRHKVCGEYLSMESRNYLSVICPALNEIELPRISTFRLTSSAGTKEFETALDPGGIGISRFLLEDLLYRAAKNAGVSFLLDCKARKIVRDTLHNRFTLITDSGIIQSLLVCDSTGRRSNLQPLKTSGGNANYVGVKYHVRMERPSERIEIHSFTGGYCGISNVEDGKSCLCYMVNSKQLNEAGNNIPLLEKNILFRNRELKRIFESAEFVFKSPLTVSGIDFSARHAFRKDLFFLGDAAGSISPVTGNGMSMGLRSAAQLAGLIHGYFSQAQSMDNLSDHYSAFWKNEFAVRIRLSRNFQRLSESPILAGFTIVLFNAFPALAKKIIRLTHGKPFCPT